MVYFPYCMHSLHFKHEPQFFQVALVTLSGSMPSLRNQ